MTSTYKLKALFIEKGLTLSDVADKIGISKTSLSYKVNNKVEFKVSEITKLCELLDISDKDAYFFVQ